MKEEHSKKYRILTILCCMSIICSTVLPCFVIGADAGYTEDTTLTASAISGLKETNLLAGLSPEASGVVDTGSSANWRTMLTDGKGFTAKLNEANGATITYELAASYVISSFCFWQGTNKADKKVSYEVYVSSGKSDLYTSGRLIYSWDALKNTKSMGQKVTFSSKSTGKYIGIKITNTCSDSCDQSNADHRIANIYEIGVWGEIDNREYSVSASTDKGKIATLADTNLLKDKLPYETAGISGGDGSTHNWKSELTNGLDTSYNDLYCESGKKIYLTYSLDTLTEIDSFAFWGSNTGRRVSYEVYSGNDAGTLYDTKAICRWNDDGSSTAQIFTFNDGKKPQGIYVGILITSPSQVSGDMIARIAEIGVWGNETYGANVNNSLSYADISADYDTNILKGLQPEETTAASGSEGWKAGLTDGKADAVTVNDADSATFTYKLSGRTKVSAFAFWNGASSAAQKISYAVYISGSKSGLYSSTPIFTYDASSDTGSVGQKVTFSEFNQPAGKYIGIKLINCCSDGCDKSDPAHKSAVISELQAWGELSDVTFDTEVKPSDIPGLCRTSIIKGIPAEATLLGSENWNYAVTNGAEDNDAYIENAVGSEVIFTLPATAQISNICLWNGNVRRIGYDVYVSGSAAALFGGEPVYSVDSSEHTEEALNVVFPAGALPSGKYIGIKITSTSDKDSRAYISEIGVWGKLDYSELTDTTLNADDIAKLNDTNLISGLKANTAMTGNTAYLTDGNGETHDFSNAKGSSFTYILPYTVKVTSFALWMGNSSLRVSYEVYIGNSVSTLYENDPVFVWNASDSNSTAQKITFPQGSQPIGLYLGVKITDTGKGDPYNIARISEMGLWGVQTSDTTDPVKPGINTDVTPDDVILWNSENLISGMTYSTFELENGKVTTDSGKALTDGVAGVGKHLDLYDSTNAKITYDLLRTADISAFMLYQSHTGELLRVSYKVFAGDNIETLYSSETIFTWNAHDNVSSIGQKITFNENQRPRGRYVGILITETCSDNCGKEDTNHLMARICEIGVYGNADFSEEAETLVTGGISDAQIADSHSDNLLKSLTPSIQSRSGDDRTPENTEILTDGLTDGTVVLKNASSTSIIYSLGRMADVNGILISATKALGEYRVYLSDNIDDLFKYKNIVIEYSPEGESDKTQLINASRDSVAYMAVKILNPDFDGSFDAYLNELALYGSFKKYTVSYPDTGITVTEYDSQNLLKGKDVAVKYFDGSEAQYEGRKGVYERYTDGKTGADDHQDIYNADKGVTITYSLGEKYIIDLAAVYNFPTIPQKAYQIYISNSESTLYNPSNLVVDYSNNSKSWAQVFTMADDDKPSGRFVGFRFAEPNYIGDADLRITELVVTGTAYVPKPVNLAESAAVNAYRTVNGNTSRIPESDFSQSEKLRFVDGDNNDPVSVNTGGKVSFVVDLCEKMDITSFVVNNDNLTSFNIFTALSESELWTNPKLAASYNGLESKITLPVDINCRYIRLEVTGCSSGEIRLNSFEAIGLDVQQLDIDNQLYSISYERVKLFAQNKKDYSYKVLTEFYGYSKIVDNYTQYGASISGADYDTETLNLVFNFPTLKMIRTVIINTLGRADYNPGNIKIYLADSISSIMSADAVPVLSYTYSDSDANTDEFRFDFSPTAATYLRISFDESCSREVSPDKLMAVVTEIKAMGVDCKNVLPADDDGETCLYIKDSESGVALRMLRLFRDDVNNSITDMRVERIAASAAQKALIDAESFSLSGQMYNVHLYDYFGNEVTDFGGRTVEITVPIPNGIKIAYLAGYYSGKFCVLNAGYDENNIKYSFVDSTPRLEFGIVTLQETQSVTDVDFIDKPTQDVGDNVNTDDPISAPDTENETIQENIPKPSGSNVDEKNSNLFIGIIISVAAVVVAVLTLIVLIIKKKKRSSFK